MYKKSLFIACACMMLAMTFESCSREMSAEEIFEKEKSGVVLVLNQFYYEVEMPTGQKLYFTGMDKNGNLQGFTVDEQEVKQHPGMLNGTGFFIGNDGKILTNRHVVTTDIDEKQLRANLQRVVRSMIMESAYELQRIEIRYDQLELMKQRLMQADGYDVQEQINEIVSEQRRLKDAYERMTNYTRRMRYNTAVSDLNIRLRCDIGISYDGVKVKSPADFLKKNPCHIVKVSDKENADLAILQLNSKQTPSNAYVFQFAGDGNDRFFNGDKSEEKLKIDQQLYMIGYNAGLVLANTEKGISVQMTSGRITQTPDEDRVLYSIPTVQGSSGSPIVDTYGNVVAVNFAKLAGSDNFNFGIPIAQVKAFLKGVK